MERSLERQRESIKARHEKPAQTESSLQEKTRQLEAAQAALDARVQAAV